MAPSRYPPSPLDTSPAKKMGRPNKERPSMAETAYWEESVPSKNQAPVPHNRFW